jgi:hypothetical protein
MSVAWHFVSHRGTQAATGRNQRQVRQSGKLIAIGGTLTHKRLQDQLRHDLLLQQDLEQVSISWIH